jgi:hypothetical protein
LQNWTQVPSKVQRECWTGPAVQSEVQTAR